MTTTPEAPVELDITPGTKIATLRTLADVTRDQGRVSVTTLLSITLFFACLSVLSHQSGLDLLLSRAIFSMEGGSTGFAWKHNFWLYNILHEGGRSVVKRLFFVTLGLYLVSFRLAGLRPWRAAFLYIVLSILASTSMVGLFKQFTTIPCPQALAEFGGSAHWVSFWQLFSPDLPQGHCYPAGHASGGYAWLCLAFVHPVNSRRFYLWLLPGLTLGLAFGIAQQLRGAHFLSHDLMTLAVSLGTVGTIARVMPTSLYCRAPPH